MGETAVTLEKLLTGMRDIDQPIRTTGLLMLSGLLPEDISGLDEQWGRIPDDRRVEIVTQLVIMAEEGVDCDFNTFLCLALTDSNARVRERSIAGLWESEDRSMIPILLDHLTNDSAETVRAMAATVLGRFAVLAQMGKLLDRDGQKVYKALIDVLLRERSTLEVQRRALESVGAFQSAEVSKWIRWGYHSDDPKLRQSALYAMGRNCDRSWLETIFDELQSEEPAMRYEAANACRELGEDEAIPRLAVLVNDDDLQVQVAAIQALGAIGGASVKKLLTELAQRTTDEGVREAAEAAVGEFEWQDPQPQFE